MSDGMEVQAGEVSPPEPNAMQAVERAFAAVDNVQEAPAPEAKPAEATSESAPAPADKAEKPEKVEAKADDKPATDDGGRERNPDGTFKAKEDDGSEAEPDATKANETDDKTEDKEATEKDTDTADDGFGEAPARFSPDAKQAWKEAPLAVRAEINRAITELESGLEKHRESAKAFDDIKDFDAMARQNGTTVRDALQNYTNLETAVQNDPIRGLEMVCDYAGLSLRDVAAHVMGQKPEETQSRSDATIRELKHELQSLKQELGGVSSTINETKMENINREVAAFAAEHPRFDELSDEITRQLSSGDFDLATAYKRAELLNPVPQPAPKPKPDAAHTATTKTDSEAHTQKGSLSVTGSPGAGSDPDTRKPPKNPMDALDRAFAAAGIS